MKRNLPRSTADRVHATPGPGTLIVLGLDPGTLATGYGIVASETGIPHEALVGCGSIRNDAAESTMAIRPAPHTRRSSPR
jgi:hypothetical protein